MSLAYRNLLLPLFICAATWAPSLLAQQAPSTAGSTATTQNAPTPSTQDTEATGAAQTPAALPDVPQATAPPVLMPTGPTAVFDTSMGQMRCRLFSKEAPNTVANFIGLAEGTKDWTNPKTHQKEHGVPLYNGTIFHRVIPGFMIQGGDPVGDGTGDPGYFINDEIVPGLDFDVPGRLAMANSGPNTDGSQFFITVAPYPSLNGNYTIFGQCDDGSVSVANAIAAVDRDQNDKPYTPVVLNKVLIIPVGQPVPAPPAPPAAPQAAPPQTAPSNPQ